MFPFVHNTVNLIKNLIQITVRILGGIIHKAFENSFGIINGTNDKVSCIILAFKIDQGRYIKSLPLHHSQKLISQNDNEIRFEYQLKPTFDFIQEILSHGSDVEVIAPLSLRKNIIEKLKASINRYT